MAYPNLKAEMARHEIGADDVAVATGVSTRTVHNWLNGTSVPDMEQGKAIKSRFFCALTLDYLFADSATA